MHLYQTRIYENDRYNTLDPTIGAEIKKTKPAIILNDDSLGMLPLKIRFIIIMQTFRI
jgi:hypothetical protein